MKFYQLAEIQNGVMTVNEEKMQGMLQNLFNGRYLLTFQKLNPKSSIKDYRGCYFSKVDALGLETGHSRYEMHDLIKTNVLSEIVNQLPELVENDELTTKNLGIEAWIILLEALDLWAFTEYNVILN